jgi:RNA polymerase sigma-70 factor (ECF subfamily)
VRGISKAKLQLALGYQFFTYFSAAHPGGHDPTEVRRKPASLAEWTELHELMDGLPAEEREVIGLLFYQGLSQAEAAGVLKVGLRTVQRRWHDALCRLHRAWNGE